MPQATPSISNRIFGLPGAAVGVAACLAWAGFGCSGELGPEERSSRDVSRTGAQEIPLDVVVTDGVSVQGGDSTDWKKFEAPGAGDFTIEVFWDSPTVRGTVTVADQYGETIHTFSHASDNAHDTITLELPSEGIYFLRFYIDYYRSTYSLRAYPGSPRSETVTSTEEEPRPELDRPIEE